MFGNTLLVFARIRPIPAGKTPGATHVGQSNCSVLFMTFISFNGKVFHPTNWGAARKLECRTEIWTGRQEADNCSIQADESDTNRIPIPEGKPRIPFIVRVYVIGIVIPVMLYALCLQPDFVPCPCHSSCHKVSLSVRLVSSSATLAAILSALNYTHHYWSSGVCMAVITTIMAVRTKKLV